MPSKGWKMRSESEIWSLNQGADQLLPLEVLIWDRKANVIWKEAIRERSCYILSDLVNIKAFWKIPEDEGGLFQNAWFHDVLYFERLRALTLHVKERRCLDLREVTRVGGDVRSWLASFLDITPRVRRSLSRNGGAGLVGRVTRAGGAGGRGWEQQAPSTPIQTPIKVSSFDVRRWSRSSYDMIICLPHKKVSQKQPWRHIWFDRP